MTIEHATPPIVEDLKILHRNCDPMDMTYEDNLVWERWNKVFNPEDYEGPA